MKKRRGMSPDYPTGPNGKPDRPTLGPFRFTP
jgi:hypothetical protein